LTTDQVEALRVAMPESLRAQVTFAAGTGLRQGECFGLTVDRLDFLRRQMTVDRQLVTVSGRPPYMAPPKTAASVRPVPLPHVVLDAMAAHLAASPAAPEELVFTLQGQASTRSTFGHLWPTSPAARASRPAPGCRR
jgi:integrase